MLPRYFLPGFESIGFSIQEKKCKIDVPDRARGAHLGFSIGTILAIFDLQVAPILLTKFRVSWLFCSGCHGGHLGFPNETILAIFFLSASCPDTSKQVSILSVQEKKRKIEFQDGGHGRHFGFPIKTILATFDL